MGRRRSLSVSSVPLQGARPKGDPLASLSACRVQALGASYLFKPGSGVLGAGESPSDVQEVHPVAQLSAHFKGQLRRSHRLSEGLGLQNAAPEVKAEGTVPVSAGFSRPQRAARGHGTGIITHWGQLCTSHIPPRVRLPGQSCRAAQTLSEGQTCPKLVPKRVNLPRS